MLVTVGGRAVSSGRSISRAKHSPPRTRHSCCGRGRRKLCPLEVV